MKIKIPSSALERLSAGTHIIIIGYTDRAKVEALLENLHELKLSSAPYFDELRRTVMVAPVKVGHKFEYNLVPEDIGKGIKGYRPKEIIIPRFDDDEEFYAALSKRQSTIKIIDDKYSALRGAILFEYISEIEKRLRHAYRNFYDTDELKKSKNYRKDTPDHFIAYYDLSEMIGEQLLAPASHEYYLELLKNASGTIEKIAARTATRLEELQLPLSPEELRKFTKIRNSVMHFRVLTYQQAVELLDLSERYQHYEMTRMFKLLKPAGAKS